MATSAALETRVPDWNSLWKVYYKERTKGRTSEHRNNVWETKDTRTHREGQACVTTAYRQLKNAMRKSREEETEKEQIQKNHISKTHSSSILPEASLKIRVRENLPFLPFYHPTPKIQNLRVILWAWGIKVINRFLLAGPETKPQFIMLSPWEIMFQISKKQLKTSGTKSIHKLETA